MRRQFRAPALLVLIGSVLLLSACTRQKATEKIEGTVLDAAGKPLEKVRVFNSGDSLPSIETYSAANGRFCLRDFGTGRVWLFAVKEGYRFAAVRPKAGATDVRLALVASREPPPARAAASEPTPLGEQQRLAHRMLERLWGGGALGNRCYWLSSAMSRIDPELAVRWAIDGRGDCVDFIRAAMAEQIADKDFDEALGLLSQSGGDGLNALIRLARRYAASDPAKALRCVEELVVGGRAFDQPWRAGYLAEAGALAIRLGMGDTGRKLLDEAGTMATKLGSEQAHAGARGMVAEALATSDLERALKLIEPITPMNSPERYRAHVAVAICLQNLDQALAIAGKIRTGGYADRARLRMAIHLAPTRPADAIRVAEMIGGDRKYSRDSVGKT